MRKGRTVRERNAVNENESVIAQFNRIAVRPRDNFEERLAIAPHVKSKVIRRHPLSGGKSVNRNLNEVAFLRESVEFQPESARNGSSSVKNEALGTNESGKN